MTYLLDINRSCKRKINKVCKKNPAMRKAIENKIDEILCFPERFKPLRHSEKGKRRVHILKSFVMTYSVKGGVVCIIDFEHHDRAYRR